MPVKDVQEWGVLWIEGKRLVGGPKFILFFANVVNE